jgi:Trk K+ transport system NAD-binding subunit
MKTVGSHLASFLAGRNSVRREMAPFVRFLALLSAVVLVYAWLFHLIMEREGQSHSWFTGVYWTLTVMTTLGFGDITFQSDIGRFFSVFVLVSGVFMLLIVMPFMFVRAVYEPWVERRNRLRLRTIRTIPDGVRDHVLVCANDPIAFALVRRLELANVPAYIIEPDEEIALRLREAGLPVIAGEVDDVDTFDAANIGTARLVFANSSDPENTNIVLTVRERNATVPIVSLVESEDSMDILQLAGATDVLPLTQQLGEHLANRVSAGVAHANTIGRFRELVLAEFPAANTPFQGCAIRDVPLRDELGLSIIGVWDHGRLEPARPDLVLSPLSVPVVIGTEQQIDDLNELLVIYNTNLSPVIVIGGGKVGRAAAGALKARGVPVHIVEKDPGFAARCDGLADEVIVGDAADRRVLDRAGIAEAPSILLTTHDDAMNIYLTVYCRRLNPSARILTRVTHERNVEAIQRAGADFVLSYASLGVQSVLAIVQGRELALLGEGVDVFYVPLPKSLIDRTLADARIGERCELNVIALQQPDGSLRVPAAADRLPAGTTLVAIGTPADRDRFRKAFG